MVNSEQAHEGGTKDNTQSLVKIQICHGLSALTYPRAQWNLHDDVRCHYLHSSHIMQLREISSVVSNMGGKVKKLPNKLEIASMHNGSILSIYIETFAHFVLC